jgi:hypothetical protein
LQKNIHSRSLIATREGKGNGKGMAREAQALMVTDQVLMINDQPEYEDEYS